MILYHGSFKEIKTPDLIHSRDDVDFGKGFYTTPFREQAISWSSRFKKQEKDSVVSVYVTDEVLWKNLKVKRFDSYSEQWLDFVTSCRKKRDNTDFDIVIGGVANDRVFNTIELFYSNLIEKEVAIERLRYEKPNLQVCFRTAKALECLRFKESFCLYGGDEPLP